MISGPSRSRVAHRDGGHANGGIPTFRSFSAGPRRRNPQLLDGLIAEAELAEQLAISRTPMREALLRLSDEGLVEIYPQSGSFVAPVRIDAVSEAQFVREHLECAVIREVAVRIDPRGLASLRNNLGQQEAALACADPEHRAIVDALAAHDVELADAALRLHLREVYATIAQLGLDTSKETLPRGREEGR
jgi:DNA-binding GntR family transcriptional regulator